MQRLLDGYQRFRQHYWREHRAVFDALASQGQNPRAMVIACSDSRVDPTIIFDAAPGEIFVLRNVANLVPPYEPNSDHHGTSAALEFAVRGLAVDHIIVLGHSTCGGIKALFDENIDDKTDFIGHWMAIAAPARERAIAAAGCTGPAAIHLCERESIRISLDNLRGFPWIAERVAAGTLQLHGWYFDIETGEIEPVASI